MDTIKPLNKKYDFNKLNELLKIKDLKDNEDQINEEKEAKNDIINEMKIENKDINNDDFIIKGNFNEETYKNTISTETNKTSYNFSNIINNISGQQGKKHGNKLIKKLHFIPKINMNAKNNKLQIKNEIKKYSSLRNLLNIKNIDSKRNTYTLNKDEEISKKKQGISKRNKSLPYYNNFNSRKKQKNISGIKYNFDHFENKKKYNFLNLKISSPYKIKKNRLNSFCVNKIIDINIIDNDIKTTDYNKYNTIDCDYTTSNFNTIHNNSFRNNSFCGNILIKTNDNFKTNRYSNNYNNGFNMNNNNSTISNLNTINNNNHYVNKTQNFFKHSKSSQKINKNNSNMNTLLIDNLTNINSFNTIGNDNIKKMEILINRIKRNTNHRVFKEKNDKKKIIKQKINFLNNNINIVKNAKKSMMISTRFINNQNIYITKNSRTISNENNNTNHNIIELKKEINYLTKKLNEIENENKLLDENKRKENEELKNLKEKIKLYNYLISETKLQNEKIKEKVSNVNLLYKTKKNNLEQILRKIQQLMNNVQLLAQKSEKMNC